MHAVLMQDFSQLEAAHPSLARSSAVEAHSFSWNGGTHLGLKNLEDNVFCEFSIPVDFHLVDGPVHQSPRLGARS